MNRLFTRYLWPWTNRPRQAWLLVAAATLAVAGAKFQLIQVCGTDVPFGDQWAGEAATTYAPFVQGEFGIGQLFTPHNEHRIIFTRLFDLLLLRINGQWDPRLQLIADVFILMAALALLLHAIARRLAPLPATAVIVAGISLYGSVVLWENTLNGFQSQFYFMLLFSILHVLRTVESRPFSRGAWVGHVAGLCNLMTLALGMISAFAVLGWLAWRRLRCFERRKDDPLIFGWNLALVVGGWILLPVSPRSGGLGPPTLTAWGETILHILSWPVAHWPAGLFIWAPGLVFLAIAVIRPKRVAGYDWLLALGLLALLLAGATSVTRGGIASRYADHFSLGIIFNLSCLFCCRATGRWLIVLIAFGTLWVSTVAQNLWRQEKLSHEITLRHLPAQAERRGAALRQFLASGDRTILERENEYSPPDLEILDTYRRRPELAAVLPFSIRSPLPLTESENASNGGFRRDAAPALPGALAALPIWGTWDPEGGTTQAEWRSPDLESRFPVLAFYVAGELVPPDTSLTLVTADGKEFQPMQAGIAATARWTRLNFANPGAPFHVKAHDHSPVRWLAFSAPLESGRLSWFAPKVFRVGPLLSIFGWLLVSGVALVTVIAWLRNEGSTESPSGRPPS